MTLKRLTRIAMVAAIYAVLSIALAPLSYGPIQIRFSEALTMLPLIWQPAIPALTIGCFITNLVGTAMGATGAIDIVFGTLATFLAAVCTYKLRDVKTFGIPFASILMPVLFNGVIIGLELGWMLSPDHMWEMSVIYGLQVAAGELVAVVIDYVLVEQLEKTDLFKE